jgi:hypothetical protein
VLGRQLPVPDGGQVDAAQPGELAVEQDGRGHLHVAHAGAQGRREPLFQRRQAGYPLDADELRSLLHADEASAQESLLFYRAHRAGQVTNANLYAASEPIVTPNDVAYLLA